MLMMAEQFAYPFINRHLIHLPIRFLKRLRMVCHILLTRRCVRRRLACLAPVSARPRTAKRRSEKEPHIVKLVFDHAIGRKMRQGPTPFGCIRGRANAARVEAVGNVEFVGDFAAREEPDADGIDGPFGGKDAATGLVKLFAVAADIAVWRRYAAADAWVWVCFGGLRATDFSVDFSEKASDGKEGALVVGVQRHAIAYSFVSALDDVDFTVVGSDQPEGRPNSANAARHVCNVGDEEALIISRLGTDTNTGAPVRGFVNMVHADINATIPGSGSINEFLGVGGTSVNILDESMPGV